MLRTVLSVLAAGLLAAGVCAFADQWDKKTVVTLTETVQAPGAVLTPGKYVFKLVSSESNRHIVQVTNERGTHVYTTILAIPNYRLEPKGDSIFEFWETPTGNPKALRAWFYPGDNFGQEFAYPKGLSAKIAETAHTPVPSVTAETVAELKTAPVTEVQPTGEEKAIALETRKAEPEPVAATEPAPAAARWTEPEPAPAAEPAPQEPAARKELPATGSPYALIGLAGLFAVGAGVAIRTLVRRAS